jgi:rubrerythrin
MYYTMAEAIAILGRNEEQIKVMATEGRLKLHNDGTSIFLRADLVDAEKAKADEIRRNRPTPEQYQRTKIALMQSWCPEIYPCKECGYPVIDGYCCQYCGTNNPR